MWCVIALSRLLCSSGWESLLKSWIWDILALMSKDSEQIDVQTGSHPAIRFGKIPIVEGPLSCFSRVRIRLLADVVEETAKAFLDSGL